MEIWILTKKFRTFYFFELLSHQVQTLRSSHRSDWSDDEILGQHSRNFVNRRQFSAAKFPLENREILQGERGQKGVDGLLQSLVPDLS